MELHGMICLQMKDEAGPNAMSFMGKWWRTHLRFLPGGLKNTAGGGWSHQRCPWVCIKICILPWLVFMSQHRFVDSAFCSKRKYGTPHFQGVGTKIGRIWELDGIRWSFSRWWFAFTIHGFSVSTMFDPSFFRAQFTNPIPEPGHSEWFPKENQESIAFSPPPLPPFLAFKLGFLRFREIPGKAAPGAGNRKTGNYRYLTVAQAEMNIHSPPFTTLLFGKSDWPTKKQCHAPFQTGEIGIAWNCILQKNETQSSKPLTVIQNWGTPIKPFAYVHDMSPWFLCCSIPYIHHGDSGGLFNNDRGKGHFPNWWHSCTVSWQTYWLLCLRICASIIIWIVSLGNSDCSSPAPHSIRESGYLAPQLTAPSGSLHSAQGASCSPLSPVRKPRWLEPCSAGLPRHGPARYGSGGYHPWMGRWEVYFWDI